MAIASIVFCIPAAGPTASFLGISMDIPSQVWCHQRDLRPLRAVLRSINGKRQDAASMVSLRNESCVGGCRMMFLIDIQPIYTWYIYIYKYVYNNNNNNNNIYIYTLGFLDPSKNGGCTSTLQWREPPLFAYVRPGPWCSMWMWALGTGPIHHRPFWPPRRIDDD